jgi:hypothetical protein
MISARCHCGDVRIDMRRKPRSITTCNCSVCRRYGAMWAYFTRKSLDYGFAPGAVAPYAWGNASIEFFHCVRCGCVTHWERARKDGDETRVGVNVRNVDPAAVTSVPVKKLDGARTWKTLEEWEHGWA